MSSWFDTGLSTLTSLTANVTEKVQNASKAVQNAIPKEQQELLAKLTLNTDEMKATRQQFGEEARRKLEAQQRLGQLLPWETKDPDREILVDECKDAVLELSKNIDTFYGPYEVPMLNVHLEDDDDDDEEGEGGGRGDDNEDGGNLGHDVPAGDASGNDSLERKEDDHDTDNDGSGGANKHHNVRSVASQHFRPSAESQKKLEKLQPLPPLLEDFDLDAHVGLIQRLLKEDPELVQKQAALSGGGARERVFWQNYFFHCAYTRYEAGLSIDEIWSYQKSDSEMGDDGDFVDGPNGSAADGITASAASSAGKKPTEEEIVVFDSGAGGVLDPTDSHTEPTFRGDEVGESSPAASGSAEYGQTDGAQSTSGFELVDDEGDEDRVVGDPELDELEAEIARELEGL